MESNFTLRIKEKAMRDEYLEAKNAEITRTSFILLATRSVMIMILAALSAEGIIVWN